MTRTLTFALAFASLALTVGAASAQQRYYREAPPLVVTPGYYAAQDGYYYAPRRYYGGRPTNADLARSGYIYGASPNNPEGSSNPSVGIR